MKISTLKEAIGLCREADVTPFVWGNRGLGKSSIIKQISAEGRMGFVDLRCSQMEASDIRGLPDREEGRTVFRPPADMPVGDMNWEDFVKAVEETPQEERYKVIELLQPRLKKGILFLDELNRAQDDVLQAVFQLVLDRKVGQYVVPPGWSIVVAGNFMEGYMVNGFTDPAFLDRFCHVVLSDGETTLEEWVNYMSDVHGSKASSVVEFASQNVKHLDGEVKAELGFSVQPSRRSWESVIRIDKAYLSGEYTELAKTEVMAGLIGRELAIAYSRYDCPVKPKDLITHGIDKLKPKLGRLSRGQAVGLMWGLVSFCKPNIEDDKHADVACDFAEWICREYSEKDLVVAFCKALLASKSGAADNIRAAAISNPNVAKLLAKATRSKKGPKTFLDRLNARPALQKILSKTSWGE